MGPAAPGPARARGQVPAGCRSGKLLSLELGRNRPAHLLLPAARTMARTPHFLFFLCAGLLLAQGEVREACCCGSVRRRSLPQTTPVAAEQRHCGGAGAFLLCAWRRARTRPHPCAVCVCELELRRVARLPPTLPHDAPTGADMAPRLRQARSARGMRQLSAPMRGRCAHAASLPVCAHRPGTGLCRCLRRWHCSCPARSRPPSARLADAHASPRMPRLASESWASPLRLPLAGPTGRDARSWERRTGAVNGARACSRGGCEESPGQ